MDIARKNEGRKKARFTWSCDEEDLMSLKIVAAMKQKNNNEILHLALIQYIENNFDKETAEKIKSGNF